MGRAEVPALGGHDRPGGGKGTQDGDDRRPAHQTRRQLPRTQGGEGQGLLREGQTLQQLRGVVLARCSALARKSHFDRIEQKPLFDRCSTEIHPVYKWFSFMGKSLERGELVACLVRESRGSNQR